MKYMTKFKKTTIIIQLIGNNRDYFLRNIYNTFKFFKKYNSFLVSSEIFIANIKKLGLVCLGFFFPYPNIRIRPQHVGMYILNSGKILRQSSYVRTSVWFIEIRVRD